MQLDVWSDIICPWCWLGKRRLERALERFAQRDRVVVRWRSFELDPQAARVTEGTLDELLVRKYGISLDEARRSHARLTELGAKDGLEYRFDLAKPANTLDAHRLVHFANGKGRAGPMQDRLMLAYFHEGKPIGDRSVLASLAGDVGLDAREAAAALDGDAFVGAVRDDEREAAELGIRGVPCVVSIDRGIAVSGAQEVDTFLELLQQAWADDRASA